MNHQTLSKRIAAAVMVFVVAGGIYFDQVTRGREGRAAYLEKQGERYDWLFARPSPITDTAIAFLIVGTFFGVYEVIAYGTLLFLHRLKPEEPESK